MTSTEKTFLASHAAQISGLNILLMPNTFPLYHLLLELFLPFFFFLEYKHGMWFRKRAWFYLISTLQSPEWAVYDELE